MESNQENPDTIGQKLIERMSVRQDIFKQRIQTSTSNIAIDLQQAFQQLSQQIRDKMLRKVENIIQSTQQQFKSVLNKVEKAHQDYENKSNQDKKDSLLTDTQMHIPKDSDVGLSDSQKQIQQQNTNSSNEQEKKDHGISSIIQQAKALIQTDELREKEFEINPNTQKIKLMLLNQIEKSSSQNQGEGNLHTYNSAKLPESDVVIKFAEKEQYIEVYDVLSSTRKKVPTQVKFHDCSATFQIGLNLYVAGGQNSINQQLENNLYQVSSNGDSFQLAHLIHARGMLNLTGCKDYLIASGGCDYQDNPFNYVEQFKFVNMQWKDVPPLISARFGHAACVVSKPSDVHNSSYHSDKTSTSQQANNQQNGNQNWEDINEQQENQVANTTTTTFPVSSNQVVYVFCGAISSSTDTNNIERLKGGSSYWQVLKIYMPIQEGRYFLVKVIPNRSQILLMGGLDKKDMVLFSLDCQPMEAKYRIKNAPDAAFNCPVVMWQNILYTISDISDKHYELYKMNLDDTFQMIEVTDI